MGAGGWRGGGVRGSGGGGGVDYRGSGGGDGGRSGGGGGGAGGAEAGAALDGGVIEGDGDTTCAGLAEAVVGVARDGPDVGAHAVPVVEAAALVGLDYGRHAVDHALRWVGERALFPRAGRNDGGLGRGGGRGRGRGDGGLGDCGARRCRVGRNARAHGRHLLRDEFTDDVAIIAGVDNTESCGVLELIDLGAVALVVAMDAADCEGCLFDTANSTLREGRDFVLARAATARGDLAKDSGRSQEEPCQGLGCGQHGQTSDNSRVGKTMGTTTEETPPLLDSG